MEFRTERFTAELLDPRRGFEPTRSTVEVRWDPLTGQSCRLLPAGSLQSPEPIDVSALAEKSRPTCPFCAERVESETPKFLEAVVPEGRVSVGEALLFPNLLPYAKWSSVCVYSPGRHRLMLYDLTPLLIADNLWAQVQFLRAVRAHDPPSDWTSINVNQLPPSGSSIFHPHSQGSANPVPTTAQGRFADLNPTLIRQYVDLERETERFVTSHGPVTWLASFAPVGIAEIRALVIDATSPTELSRDTVVVLAGGIATVLQLYADLGFQSFNLALHGAGGAQHGGAVILRMVARAYFGASQRSDVMWSERLHAEAATDVSPERLAGVARELFADRPA
jgi:UDPglucose--hexose-1-phosphate uridylyltransferase